MLGELLHVSPHSPSVPTRTLCRAQGILNSMHQTLPYATSISRRVAIGILFRMSSRWGGPGPSRGRGGRGGAASRRLLGRLPGGAGAPPPGLGSKHIDRWNMAELLDGSWATLLSDSQFVLRKYHCIQESHSPESAEIQKEERSSSEVELDAVLHSPFIKISEGPDLDRALLKWTKILDYPINSSSFFGICKKRYAVFSNFLEDFMQYNQNQDGLVMNPPGPEHIGNGSPISFLIQTQHLESLEASMAFVKELESREPLCLFLERSEDVKKLYSNISTAYENSRTDEESSHFLSALVRVVFASGYLDLLLDYLSILHKCSRLVKIDFPVQVFFFITEK